MKSLDQLAVSAHRAFWMAAAKQTSGPEAIENAARADASMEEEVKQAWIAAVQQIRLDLASIQ